MALLAEVGEFPEYHHYLQDHFISHGIEVPLQRNIPKQSTMDDAHKVSFIKDFLTSANSSEMF